MPRILREVFWLALPLVFAVSTAHGADYRIATQTRISASGVGSTGAAKSDFDAVNPAIAVDAELRRALIIWSAADGSFPAADPNADDTDRPSLAKGEFEIFGRLIDAELLANLTNPLRISTMGDDLETDAAKRALFAGRHPAVVWNPVAEEYLAIWEGDEANGALVDDEFEIFGQRISRTGALEGERFRISVMGDDDASDPAERARYSAQRPAMSVDSKTGNYLVVWQGDTDDGVMVDEEFEIFGRVIAANGVPAGDQFRISTMGDDSATDAAVRAGFDGYKPAVAYNPVSAGFFVTWEGDDNQAGLADGEFEIHAQRVDAEGALSGSMIRVSSMGPDGSNAFDALSAAIAIVPDTGTTFIVWHGDTSTSPLVDDEFEIHGRLFDAAGMPLGSSVQVSTMGSSSETDPAERVRFKAEQPAVSWSTRNEHFLVTWRGDTESGDLVDDEFEIHGRFMDANGAAVTSRFLVSEMGAHSDSQDAEERRTFAAQSPRTGYVDGYFLATWYGDSTTNGQDEIHAQRLAQEHAVLKLTPLTTPGFSKAPEPITYEFELENTGDTTAENVRMLVANSADFPISLAGCDEVVEETTCMLGDIATGEKVSFVLTVHTDQIKLGDPQKTQFTIRPLSDIALKNPGSATLGFVTLVSLTVEGGNGAVDVFWFLMLGTGALLLRRRKAGAAV